MVGWVRAWATNKFILGMAGLGVLFVLLGVGYINQPYKFSGTLIDPPMPIQNFKLIDGNGGAYQLSDAQGKYVMIFFGYTHCPDVCPITLSQFKKVNINLDQKATDVLFIFITVDPNRDTPEVLAKHLNKFDEGFIGLTGGETEIKEVWKTFGVYREIRVSSTSDSYLIDHTARIYLLDPNGNLILTYPYDVDYKLLLKDLLHLLSERG